MNQFDIYLADVPFEDVEETKIRPVLILEEKAYLISCLPITSNTSRGEDYVIKKWKDAGLKYPSAIRFLKILELDSSMISKRIGKLHPIDIIEIQRLLWQ